MVDKQKKIQHLLLRAGFGQPYGLVKAATEKMTLLELIDLVFKASSSVSLLEQVQVEFMPDKAQIEEKLQNNPVRKRGVNLANQATLKVLARRKFRVLTKDLKHKTNVEWFWKMVNGNAFLREKMTLFWHNHFASQHNNPMFVQGQINLFREHALGNFKDLLFAVSKDPVMLDFLNSKQNKKNHPNENFAREVMELFTLGEGHYTENDIKEAARAFTGWKHRNGNFRFNKKAHDDGVKNVLNQEGNWTGDDVLNILLQQKQTARYICTKLYRFFVNDKVNDLHVSQLAEVFYKSDYDIETVLRAIFTAEWFYDKRNIGALIKPPIDFLVGVFQLLEIKELPNDELVTKLQKALGQVLLAPPNVAGWGGGQEWILSSTLMLRMNLTGYLIQAALSEGNERGQGKRGKRKRFTKVKSMQLLKNQKIEFTMQQLRKDLVGLSVLEQANILADYLFQVPIDKKFLLNGVSELSNPNSQLLKVVENALSLPEYQLF